MVEPLLKRLDFPCAMYRAGETNPPLLEGVALASCALRPHMMTWSGQLLCRP